METIANTPETAQQILLDYINSILPDVTHVEIIGSADSWHEMSINREVSIEIKLKPISHVKAA